MQPHEDLVGAYERDGFVNAIDIFSREEIDTYRAAFNRVESHEGLERAQIALQAWHFKEEFVWKLATDVRILNIMAEIMGEDILLLSTHFFCKYPEPDGPEHASKFVAWHQDATYWGLDPSIAHTAWIAIDESDVENGCMQVIPGSHTSGITQHDVSSREGNLLSINQEIPSDQIDESRAVNLELHPGQISIHDGRLFHASQPNRSTRRRCGLTARYIPPHVKQAKLNSVGKKWAPIVVRGKDRHGNFEVTTAPFAL